MFSRRNYLSRFLAVLLCLFLGSSCFQCRIYAEESEEETELSSEIIERGINYTKYQNSDDTITYEYYADPIRYYDSDHSLEEIDTAFVLSDGVYKTSSTEAEISMPDSLSSDKSITLNYNEFEIAMSFIEDDNVSLMQGSSSLNALLETNRKTISYSNASSDYAIKYYANNLGIKEEIVLDEIPSNNVFSFDLTLCEGYIETNDLGGFDIYDEEDSLVAYISPLYLIDGRGLISEDDASYHLGVNEETDSYILDIIVDESYLQDAYYPVTIDPSIYYVQNSSINEVYVKSGFPTEHFQSDGSVKFGKDENGNIFRTFFNFGGLQSVIQGKTITNATFSVYLSAYSNEINTTVDLNRVTSVWNANTITWNSQPSFSNTADASCTIEPIIDSAYAFNITSLVSGWANETINNNGFVLKSNNESLDYAGRFYGTNNVYDRDKIPVLSVTYEATINPTTIDYINETNVVLNSGHSDIEIKFSKINKAKKYFLRISSDNGNTIEREITQEVQLKNNNRYVWNSSGKTIFSGYTGFPNDASVVLGGTSNKYYISIGVSDNKTTPYSQIYEVVLTDTTPPDAIADGITVTQSIDNGGTQITAFFDQTTDKPIHGASGIDYYLVQLCNLNNTVISENTVYPDNTSTRLNTLFSNITGISEAYVRVKSYDIAGNVLDTWTRSSNFNVIDATPPERATISINTIGWSNSSSFTLSWSDVLDYTDNNPLIFYKLYQKDEENVLQIIRNETQIGSGTNGSGNILLNDIPDGVIEVEVYSKDMNSNQSESSWITYYKDTTAPIINLESPSEGTIFGNVLSFDGSITENLGAVSWKVYYSFNGMLNPRAIASGESEAQGRICTINTNLFTDNQNYVFIVTAEDEAGNTASIDVNCAKLTADSNLADPVFSIVKTNVIDGNWQIKQRINSISLDGTIPQGTRTLMIDGEAQPSASVLDINNLNENEEGKSHSVYMRISNSLSVYYSVPVYTTQNEIDIYDGSEYHLEMSEEGMEQNSMSSNDPSLHPIVGVSGYKISSFTLEESVDSFVVNTNCDQSYHIDCYVSEDLENFIEITPGTRYYGNDFLENETVELNYAELNYQGTIIPSIVEGEYYLYVDYYRLGGDTMSSTNPVFSITVTKTNVVIPGSEYFVINTIDAPQNLSIKENVNYSILLRWDAALDEDTTYNVYRSAYGENNYVQIASELTDPFWYDYEIEYGKRFSYYVTSNKNDRESVPSDRVNGTFVQENEIKKHLGLDDHYEYQSFSDGYGNGYTELFHGNLVYSKTDGQVLSGLFALTSRRTYNSLSSSKTIMGYGWDLSFNTVLLKVYDDGEEQAVLLKDGDGSIHRFEKTENGYDSPTGEVISLSFDETNYIIDRNDGVSYIFDENGQLVSMTSKNGDYIAFTYDARGNVSEVSDSAGHTIVFNYYTSGENTDLLKEMILPDQNKVTYEYENNRLVRVKELLTSYSSGTANPSREIYSVYTYSNQKLASLTVPAADNTESISLSFTYDNDGRIASIGLPENHCQEFTYNGLNRTIVNKIENSIFSESSIQYSANGLCTSKTDASGTTVYYEYDDENNIISISYSESYYDSQAHKALRQITYEYNYDGLHNLTSMKDPMNHLSYYQYNDTDNPYSITRTIVPQTDTANMITDYTYDSDTGNLLSISDPLSRYTTYSYATDKPFLLQSKTDEYGTNTTYQYNSDNRLISSSTGINNETDIITQITSYDALGRPLIVLDAMGHQIEYQYDEKGNIVTEKIYGDNNETQNTYYEYYPNGTLFRKINNTGIYTTFYYDDLNRISRITVNETGNEITHETLYSYAYETIDDEMLYKVTVTEKEGIAESVISVSYYNHSRELTHQIKDGITSDVSYNQRGNVLSIEQSNGIKAIYSYDENANLLAVIVIGTDGSRIITSNTYDYAGNVLSTTDGMGNVTTYTYDLLNRLTSVTEPNNIVTTYSYSDTAVNDQIINTCVEANGLVNRTYLDRLGRTIKESQTGSDNSYLQHLYSYDLNSNLINHTYNDGTIISYNYDMYGNLTRENRSDSYTLYTYDSLNRQISMADYDEDDNLIYGTDLSYAYDSLNRVIQYVQSGEAVDYAYTPDSKLSSITYQDHNVLNQQTSDRTRINYSYNTNNQLTEIRRSLIDSTETESFDTNPMVEYTYDTDGILDTKKTYHNFENNVTDYILTDYYYDVFGRTNKIEYKDKTVLKESYYYVFDNNSNIIQETAQNKYLNDTTTISYHYDALNRLTEVSQSGTRHSHSLYTYDETGNRLSYTKDDLLTSYVYNDLNQLVSKTEQVSIDNTVSNVLSSFTYNLNGSLVQVEETGRPLEYFRGNVDNYPNDSILHGNLEQDSLTHYLYDDKERLVESYSDVLLSGTVTSYISNNQNHNVNNDVLEDISVSYIEGSYVYNNNNHRISKSFDSYYNDTHNTEDLYSSVIRKYHYTGESILFVSDSSNHKTVENILDPSGMTLLSERFETDSNGYYTFNYDIRSSVTSVLRSNGTNALNYLYDEYGNIIYQNDDSSLINELSFGSSIYDEETSLYYMNARYYDPSLGIFLSEDTYKGSIYSSVTHNLYSYTGNNPISFIDPTGHRLVSVIDGETGTGKTVPKPSTGNGGNHGSTGGGTGNYVSSPQPGNSYPSKPVSSTEHPFDDATEDLYLTFKGKKNVLHTPIHDFTVSEAVSHTIGFITFSNNIPSIIDDTFTGVDIAYEITDDYDEGENLYFSALERSTKGIGEAIIGNQLNKGIMRSNGKIATFLQNNKLIRYIAISATSTYIVYEAYSVAKYISGYNDWKDRWSK